MATLKGKKRQGQTRLSTNNGIPVFEDSYHYTVIADSDNESFASIRSATGLPIVGQSVIGTSVCKSLSGSQRQGSRVWDFTADFSSEVDENTETDTDPNSWTPVYKTKFERLQETLTTDQNGTPIKNSAGQPFENGITVSRFIPIWTFSQFEPATVTDEAIIDRNETVNDGVFKGRSAKTLLLTVERSVISFFFGARRRFSTYSLRYNHRKWTEKRLDVGTAYLDGSSTKPFAVASDDGLAVIVGGLDGAGAPAGGFDGDGRPVTDTPEELEFDIFEPINFSSFIRG